MDNWAVLLKRLQTRLEHHRKAFEETHQRDDEIKQMAYLEAMFEVIALMPENSREAVWNQTIILDVPEKSENEDWSINPPIVNYESIPEDFKTASNPFYKVVKRMINAVYDSRYAMLNDKNWLESNFNLIPQNGVNLEKAYKVINACLSFKKNADIDSHYIYSLAFMLSEWFEFSLDTKAENEFRDSVHMSTLLKEIVYAEIGDYTIPVFPNSDPEKIIKQYYEDRNIRGLYGRTR